MKVFVTLVILVVAAQAKSLSNPDDLQFLNKYVTPNPRHTAEEWDTIYAAAEADIPEDTTGLVPGAIPQPEDAGKVYLPAERIIGGTNAAQGQFPWQARLIIAGNFLCGGSLISNHWVLTAAHCLYGHNTFQITLGSTSRTAAQSGTVTQTSRQGTMHAHYNDETHVNDIAVIKLVTQVALSHVINVVRLPRHAQASTTFAGTSAIASGFGRINSANNQVSANLLYINVEIITNAVCARRFGSRVQASNICTLGANGKSPCNGDSGGPLVVKEADGHWTLVGAVSFGVEHCLPNNPAVYARTSSFLAWIASSTGIAIRS